MRRLPLFLALILSLALTADAAAKEVVSAKVCGVSGCEEVTDHQSLLVLQEGGPPTSAPSKSGAFYRARLAVMGDHDEIFRFSIELVPDLSRIKGEDGTWMAVSPGAVSTEFRRMTRGLDPFPAARLGGVAAPPKQASEPASDDAPLWPWLAGGLLLLAGLAYLLGRKGGRLTVKGSDPLTAPILHAPSHLGVVHDTKG